MLGLIAALGLAAIVVGLFWIALRRGRRTPKADSGPRAPEATPSTPSAPAPPAPAARPPAAGAAPAPASAPAPAPRHPLGRYRVEGVLGRGAMGAVYLGRDPDSGAEVALKTLALGDEFEGEALDEARRRFFREAEAAGRLRHPDIVAILGAGEDEGLAWIAMERLHGHDLRSHTLPERLLPPEVAVAIVARVAEALAYAHTQGVVHRDVKPANVMIDPATEQVKLTDFGIAQITDASRTRTGIVLGTPSYMAPEQLAGGRADGRSDLYSLGVMLFQLLTGRLPHAAESMARLLHAIAHEPAPDLRTLRPELPAALADAVALALQKRPEMRTDARAWAADLRQIAGMPPAPPAGGTPAMAGAAAAAGAPDVNFHRPDPRQNP